MVARGLPFCLQTSLTLVCLHIYFSACTSPISSLLAWQAPEVQTDAAQEPPTKPTGATIPTHHSILVQFCTS